MSQQIAYLHVEGEGAFSRACFQKLQKEREVLERSLCCAPSWE